MAVTVTTQPQRAELNLQDRSELRAYILKPWQKAMKAMGDGKNASEAMGQLLSQLKMLEQVLVEGRQLYGMLMQANQIAMSAATPATGEVKVLIQPRQPALVVRKLQKVETKAERSQLIRAVARELAMKDTKRRVSFAEIGDGVVEKGFDLDTKILGTMIGNVLNKSEDWKRLDLGVYEYVGVDPLS